MATEPEKNLFEDVEGITSVGDDFQTPFDEPSENSNLPFEDVPVSSESNLPFDLDGEDLGSEDSRFEATEFDELAVNSRGEFTEVFEEFDEEFSSVPELPSNVSLVQILDFNRRLTNRPGSLTKDDLDPNYNPIAVLNLHLTKSQIHKLDAQHKSDAPVISKSSLALAKNMHRYIEDRGWTIDRYELTKNGSELSAIVRSGTNRVSVTLLSPDYQAIGRVRVGDSTLYMKRNIISEEANAVGMDDLVEEKRNDFARIQSLLDYSLGNSNAKATVSLYNNDTEGYLIRKESENHRFRKQQTDVLYMRRNNHVQFDDTEFLKATTLKELVAQAYEKSIDRDETLATKLPSDLSVLEKEDGTLDLSLIDFSVLNNYVGVHDLNRALEDEIVRRVEAGETLADVRKELLTERQSLALELPNGLEATVTLEDGEVSPEDLSDELEAEDVDRDHEVDGGDDNFGDIVVGPRSSVVDRLAGLTDSKGEPLAGWMPVEKQSEKGYQFVLEEARKAAENAGVTNFEGRFDNDGVLHWKGDFDVTSSDGQRREQRKLNFKLGQFFFPAEKDYIDEDGVQVKEGVIRYQKASGLKNYIVDHYDLNFKTPNNYTIRKQKGAAQGELNDYQSTLMSRLILTGLNQRIARDVSSSIKGQVLFSSNKSWDDTFASTSINKVYKECTRIAEHAMMRPGVVDQALSKVTIDKQWASRPNDLKPLEKYPTMIDPVTFEPKAWSDSEQGQNVRYLLKGLEGFFDAEASTDGTKLGHVLYFTKEFREFLLEYDKQTNGAFTRNGTLGSTTVDKDGNKSLLTSLFLEVSDEKKREMIEKNPDLGLTMESPNKEFRQLYEAPLASLLRDNFGQYDAPDRKLMVQKMLQVAYDVIGGQFDTQQREKVKVLLINSGGVTFEDGQGLNNRFAETNNLDMGDKLADVHGNKGVASYISGVDENHPGYNKDIEDVFKWYPHIDMVQSPYSIPSRGNVGLIKELQSGDMEVLYYPEDDPRAYYIDENGERQRQILGVAGEITLIVTNMKAKDKTKLYKVEDKGKSRRLSYQQKFVLEAADAKGLLNEFFPNNDRVQMQFAHYLNAQNIVFDEKGVLQYGHIGMALNAKGQEVPKSGECLVLSASDMIVESDSLRDVVLPTSGFYLDLPIRLPIFDSNMTTSYVGILPEKLRSDSVNIDGRMEQHLYTKAIQQLTYRVSQLEDAQLMVMTDVLSGLHGENAKAEFLKLASEHGLDEDQITVENLPLLVQQRDASLRELQRDFNWQDLEGDNVDKLRLLDSQVRSGVKNYQFAIQRDKLGVDDRSIKHSFMRRHMVSREIPDSASAVLTSDATLAINELGIGPAVAYEIGLIEPNESIKPALDSAVAAKDVASVHKLLRTGEWHYKEGVDPEVTRVMGWRDPVLHRSSCNGYKFRVDNRLVGLSMNPIATEGPAADFDGDQLGICYPKSKASQKDLRTKLSVERSLRMFRGYSLLKFGMDNVDFFAQSDYCKAEIAKGNTNVKKLLKSAFDKIETSSKALEAKTLVQLAEKHGYDLGEYARLRHDYSEMANQYGLTSPEFADYKRNMSDRDIFIIKRGFLDAEEARVAGDNYFCERATMFSNTYLLNKDCKLHARYLDWRDRDSVEKSLKEMVESGAKGNKAGIDRALKFYDRGVDYEDRDMVRKATAAKVDFTGRAGAGALRVCAIAGNKNYTDEETVRVLDEKGQVQSVPIFRDYSGLDLALEIAEQPTQAVLQIKHDPEKAPDVNRFLVNYRQLYVGPKETDGPNGYVNIRFNIPSMEANEMKFVDLVPDEHLLGKTGRERWLREAQKMDDFAKQVAELSNHNGDFVLDINNGVLRFGSETHGLDRVEIDPRCAYHLGFKGSYEDLGLSISDMEIDFMQKLCRDETTGYLQRYNELLMQSGNCLDIMVQGGMDGVEKVVKANELVKSDLTGGDDKLFHIDEGRYNAHSKANFGKVCEELSTQFSRANDEYGQMVMERQALLDAMEMERLEKEREEYEALAKEAFASDIDSLGFESKALETGEKLQADIRLVSVNREMNGDSFAGPDVIDTQKFAPGGDGPQMDEENALRGKYSQMGATKDEADRVLETKEPVPRGIERVLGVQASLNEKNGEKESVPFDL